MKIKNKLNTEDDKIKLTMQIEYLNWIKEKLQEEHAINNYQGDELSYYACIPLLYQMTIDYFNNHDMKFDCYEILSHYPCYMVKYENNKYIIGHADSKIGETMIMREDNQAPRHYDKFVDLQFIQTYAQGKYDLDKDMFIKTLKKENK